jgi:hypothetical protein
MTSATQMFRGGVRRRAETRPTTPTLIPPSHRPWLSTQPLKTKSQVRRLPDGSWVAYA